MGWRVIYIEDAECLKVYLDNVKIISSDFGEITIPLSDVHSIIIDNPKLTITIQLINKCCEYNVNIVVCGIDHLPNAIINPLTGNRLAPLMLKKQINWSESIKKQAHQLIIKNKIRNQKRLLEYLKLSSIVINRLETYEDEVHLSDDTNREGLAAKTYFRELFGPNFKRFNEDVINAGLNYGYAILRSQITKTIIAKGLNPSFGIFHIGAENEFNLSDDIIEPFRPIIDAYCYKQLVDCCIFKKENKLELIKKTTIYVIYGNAKQTLFNVISMFVDALIYFFDTGDLNRICDIKIPYEEI